MTEILVLIDNDANQKIFNSFLENTEYSIIKFLRNFEETLTFLEEKIPDIIIIDDSAIIDDTLSEDLENKYKIPIIQIIDAHNSEHIKKIHFQRFNKHLEKPFSKKELTLLIEFLLYQVEIETRFNESEERYRLLFETIKEGILVHDRQGKVIASNPLAETILGITYNQIIGNEEMDPKLKIINIDNKEIKKEDYPQNRVIESGKAIKDEIIGIINPLWEKCKWLKISSMPQFNAGEKKPYRIYNTFLDITDEIEQKDFIKNDIILSSYFENSPIGLIEADYSGLKKFFEELKQKGIENLEEYLKEHPDQFLQALENTKINKINKSALQLYKVKDIAEFKNNINKLINEDSFGFFVNLMEALTNNQQNFESDTKNKNLHGEEIYINMIASIITGNEETWERVLITIIDITEEKKNQNKLNASEMRFKNMIEQSSIGMILCNPDGKVNYVNPAMIQLINLNKSNQDFVMEKYNLLKDKYLEELGLMDYFIKGFKGEPVQIPPIHYDPQRSNIDNEKVWLKSYLYPVLDMDGKIFEIAITIENITETKIIQNRINATLKEKETLLKEIHHRVKNNMQIISSLIDLQQSSIQDKNTHSIFNDMQTRIRSMSLVHEILYKSENFAKVDFDVYIKQLIDGVSSTYFNANKIIHTDIEVKNVQLDIDFAIPCALLINELLSNAYKYAFTDKTTGKININFQKEDGENYTLLVKDNGIGIDKDFFEKSKTLGIKLIRALTRQINGTIDFKNNNGTEVLVKFSDEN